MKMIKQSFWLNLWLTLLLGLAYPAAMTFIARVFFPREANGSLLEAKGRTVGSILIGQSFSGPAYFHGRPSAAGAGYDGLASNASNLGPTSKALMDRVDLDVERERKSSAYEGLVPGDLVTASASGLDPDISPAAALWQVPGVARARGFQDDALRALVENSISGRTFGVLGEPRVNVLRLNLALDALRPNIQKP